MNNQLKNYTNQLLRNVKKKNSLFQTYRQYLGADLADMQLISKFNKGIRFYQIFITCD